MTSEEKRLLEVYIQGFNDELNGDSGYTEMVSDPLTLRAYNLGRADAIIGDDISYHDKQTNKEILSKIFHEKK